MKDHLPEAENDPQVKNNQAVADYLKNRTRNKNGDDPEINALKRIIKEHPHFADSVYNLARMLQEKDDNDAAKVYWRQFINLKLDGVYAALAQKAIDNTEKRSVTKVERLPADLGNCDAGTIKLVLEGSELTDKLSEKYSSHNLDVKNIEESRLFSEGLKVMLVIEDKIEMMACPPKPNICVSDIKTQYGKPNRIFKHVSGMQTSVYRNFAVDITDNNISRVVYFSESG